jgi:hypothetical protein
MAREDGELAHILFLSQHLAEGSERRFYLIASICHYATVEAMKEMHSMRTRLFSLVALLTAFVVATGPTVLLAQDSPAGAPPLLSQADLEQLVAPIALYPDPMIALILPASTTPTDIVLAQRYLQDGNDANAIDQQNWDESVKGLARYPDVLQMMDDNLDWTNQLGAAVLAQQNDVMAAIQSQRAKAYALGNLQSTPEQQVIDEDQVIQIVPVNPNVIYVPEYDPEVIYVDRAPAVPFISFSIGFAMGAWIGGGCDWHHHGIYSQGYYRPGYGWRRTNANPHVWRPNPSRPKPRPPYRPGHGHLPGWNRPPGGHRPGGGNRPGNNRPGNNKPAIPPAGGNRPGNGHRPGGNNRPPAGTKPAVQPPNGGGNRPGLNRPGGPGPGHTKPRPKPSTSRPGLARPAITKPATPVPTRRPAVIPRDENTKRAAASRPAPQHIQRPAKPQQRSAPVHRAAPQQPKKAPAAAGKNQRAQK